MTLPKITDNDFNMSTGELINRYMKQSWMWGEAGRWIEVLMDLKGTTRDAFWWVWDGFEFINEWVANMFAKYKDHTDCWLEN